MSDRKYIPILMVAMCSNNDDQIVRLKIVYQTLEKVWKGDSIPPLKTINQGFHIATQQLLRPRISSDDPVRLLAEFITRTHDKLDPSTLVDIEENMSNLPAPTIPIKEVIEVSHCLPNRDALNRTLSERTCNVLVILTHGEEKDFAGVDADFLLSVLRPYVELQAVFLLPCLSFQIAKECAKQRSMVAWFGNMNKQDKINNVFGPVQYFVNHYAYLIVGSITKINDYFFGNPKQWSSVDIHTKCAKLWEFSIYTNQNSFGKAETYPTLVPQSKTEEKKGKEKKKKGSPVGVDEEKEVPKETRVEGQPTEEKPKEMDTSLEFQSDVTVPVLSPIKGPIVSLLPPSRDDTTCTYKYEAMNKTPNQSKTTLFPIKGFIWGTALGLFVGIILGYLGSIYFVQRPLQQQLSNLLTDLATAKTQLYYLSK